MSKTLYNQETYLVAGKKQQRFDVAGDKLKYFSVLSANHNDFEILINGYDVGNIEPRIAFDVGVDIENLLIKNKSQTPLEITVAIGVGNIIDNRSEMAGTTVSTADTRSHIKLDAVATANQTTATAVQNLNVKFDGQYMAGVVPLGKNSVSLQESRGQNHRNRAIVSTNTNGLIIRQLDLKSWDYDCGANIEFSNGYKIGLFQNQSTKFGGVWALKNFFVPAGITIILKRPSWSYGGYNFTMNYDILDANGNVV